MTADKTGTNQTTTAAGVDAAKDVVGLAAKVMDEILAGLESVAHRGNTLARSAVDAGSNAVQAKVAPGSSKPKSPKPADPKPADPASGPAGATSSPAPLVDTQVVSQVFDLAQQVLKVFGDAAGRVLQTGLGPIEKMLGGDSHRHDDVWVTLGEVTAGRSARSTFDLENSATHPVEVALTVTNPLASMKGTIPIGNVQFSPNPAQLPAATDDAPGVVSVTVTVDVPQGTPPGHYLCIVRSAQVGDLTVILGVDVA